MNTCMISGCENKTVGLGYCSKHYTRLRRYGDPLFPGIKGGGRPKRIDFEVKNGCFVLTSHQVNADGYAEIRIKGVTKKIHRHIYEQCFGKIPGGLVIRHKCDNPSCINPEHLEPGTHKDNSDDKVKRNRQAKGSKMGSSKLNEFQVLDIKRMFLHGFTNRSIARKFNIDESVISEIRTKKAWKHVTLEEFKNA